MTNIQPLATILIVEDDSELLELETYHLEKEGFKVLGFSSTKGVEKSLDGVDLMVIDRKLPDIDGCDYVRYLRDRGIYIPVIFVSAKVSDAEIEEGFLSGGDDYLRKPYNIKELIFRIKAIINRTNRMHTCQRLTFRDIMIDVDNRKCYISNKDINLTKLEFNLLSFFIEHKNKILERDYLLRQVWGDEELKQKRTVNVTINRLKKKIDPTNEKGYIEAIHGIGYKLR